ncbi:hypothetical protein, partial [Loktanella sp. SALINAS62]|uniref:hypothetical protein n=1 Tax=Loktanella sp. SALINAS62 TaxID=2706124 RepID=UPI001B8D255F
WSLIVWPWYGNVRGKERPVSIWVRIGMGREGPHDTHSLRGSFEDKLREASIDRETSDAIFSNDDVTSASAYGHGHSLAKMRKGSKQGNTL